MGECFTVGVLIVPVQLASKIAAEYISEDLIPPNIKLIGTWFVAAAAVHLICEITGLNSFYLDHGAAATFRKRRKTA